MKDRNLLILGGIILFLLYFNQKPFSICSYDYPIKTNLAVYELDFTCTASLGCKYKVVCPVGRLPHPNAFGELEYEESAKFYCYYESETDVPIAYARITITGSSCAESPVILTTFYQQDKSFTTDEKVVVNNKVDGRGDGYIVHGLIKELNLQKTGYTSFGIASLDFGYMARGHYTIEIWGQDLDKTTEEFDVMGVMKLTSSFEPLQSYNNVIGYVYLKDENNRGLGIYDVNNFDVKFKSGLQYFTMSCSYMGKDDILGGKWECSGNTGNYIGDAVVDITVKKNGYLDAVHHINVKTFIPSLVIQAYCQDLDCPFPNSAILDETKTFKFFIKHNNVLVDASTVSVKYTNPSRTMVNIDITSSVLRTGTGTYQFTYGPFSEIEAHTFTISATYPGADPQTIYPKVSVTKEEPPIVFNPWLLVIPVAIGGIILFLRRKK